MAAICDRCGRKRYVKQYADISDFGEYLNVCEECREELLQERAEAEEYWYKEALCNYDEGEDKAEVFDGCDW